MYAVLIDADNGLAINEICGGHSLQELSHETIMEQYIDGLNKAHIVLISLFPFKKKESSAKSARL